MADPLVSIVIPTYRREASLYNALCSVGRQDYGNLEIIIVDDNDEANWNVKVADVVERFRRQCTRPVCCIVNHPNRGSAMARNVGIDAAKGQYVSFLDDDDVYLPSKIRHQVARMEENSADYSLTDLALYNEDESLCEIRRRDYFETPEGRDLFICHLKYHMTGTDTMMFRTDYIRRFGGFEHIDVGDEFYLIMKAIQSGGRFVYVAECDVRAYVHTGEQGLSSGQSKIDGENQLFAFKKQYFDRLAPRDVRYIKMRHHAVLAFACKRCGKTADFVSEGVRAVICAPVQCTRMLVNLKRGREKRSEFSKKAEKRD